MAHHLVTQIQESEDGNHALFVFLNLTSNLLFFFCLSRCNFADRDNAGVHSVCVVFSDFVMCSMNGRCHQGDR